MRNSTLQDIATEEARDEITDHTIYSKLSKSSKNQKARVIFSKLAKTEHRHYRFWKKYSDEPVQPNGLKVHFIPFIQKLFGASFVIKYLERGEISAIKKYESLKHMIPKKDLPKFKKIILDEEKHEKIFADQIQGSYVKYISFIVLGLADALVEIAGIHAGSLGIYNSTELTGFAGIVAGAAASISMASAAYAQAKQGFQGSASLAAGYTGVSYFVSAVILATPYFLTGTMLTAIVGSLILGMTIIATVSWYNAVISGSSFKKDFAELAGIMLAATAILFVFGLVIRSAFHIII